MKFKPMKYLVSWYSPKSRKHGYFKVTTKKMAVKLRNQILLNGNSTSIKLWKLLEK
jgi:hypothetical protein